MNIALPGTRVPVPFFEFATDGRHAPADAPMALMQLAGCATEQWQVEGPVDRFRQGAFYCARTDAFLFASTVCDATDLRQASRQLYTEVLSLADELGFPTLIRFWNYVPDINEGDADAENYRQFCWGRAEAFDTFPRPLPAASALGALDGKLRISLLAGRLDTRVEHIENPRQVSAFEYPRQYGPRSPSFARATLLEQGDDQLLLLSGTASIVAHETRHANQLLPQLEETRNNIQCLLAGLPGLQPQQLRCYVRNPEDLVQISDAFAAVFPGYPTPAYLHAHICRRELLLEIEGVFSNRPPADAIFDELK